MQNYPFEKILGSYSVLTKTPDSAFAESTDHEFFDRHILIYYGSDLIVMPNTDKDVAETTAASSIPLQQPKKDPSRVDAVVKVENLTKIFNEKVRAVDGVSFQVYQGEIFGFLGPNGAGKTTMINMLTTLIRPTNGRAEVFSNDILTHPNAVRRIIGVVPQEYTADEDMTGYENILLCGELYGIPRKISRQRADELLNLIELTDAAERKVSTYSGGMRRRLELACGLINHPKLLFLDEPTLGLDVQTRTAIWAHIRKLREEYGMTIFMTTHYMEEADKLCDRIAIIDHGKIVKVGSPSEMKASIGGGVIEIDIKETDIDLESIISALRYVSKVERVSPNSFRIKAEPSEEAAPSIIDVIRETGYHLTRISIREPTLDEVYLQYTGKSLRQGESDRWHILAQSRTMGKARS